MGERDSRAVWGRAPRLVENHADGAGYFPAECGPSGTGRTFFLGALGHHAVEQGLRVAWFTLEDLGQLLRRHRADDTVSNEVPQRVEASAVRGSTMSEKRNRYSREFREGAVRIVEETGKPIAQVARDLEINDGTLGNWVNKARDARTGTKSLSEADYDEPKRLRAENAELRMKRDVLKRSVVL